MLRFPVLESLSSVQREAVESNTKLHLLVSGSPGTGKSLVAVHRAIFLLSAGEQVRLITYNRVLAGYLNDLAWQSGFSERFKVFTYHSWLKWFWSTNTGMPEAFPLKRDFPRLSEPDYQRIQTTFSSILRQRDKLNGVSHILVDEGQDLPRSFYEFSELTGQTLSVFADENQIITESNSTLSEIRDELHPVEFVLKENFRNTREIASFAKHFFAGEPTGLPSIANCPPGSTPKVISFAHREDELYHLARFEQKNPEKFIGIAVPTKEVFDEFRSFLSRPLTTKNPVQFYHAGYDGRDVASFTRPGIKLFIFQSSKGIEVDHMFIAGLDALPVREDITIGLRKKTATFRIRKNKNLKMSEYIAIFNRKKS